MKKSEFTKAKSEQCAKELIDYLIDQGLWGDIKVYANGKSWGNYNKKTGHYCYEQSWDSVFANGEDDPKNYVDYASGFLTMTFEGTLYEILNFYVGCATFDKVSDGINGILGKYNRYYELGHSWSLDAIAY